MLQCCVTRNRATVIQNRKQLFAVTLCQQHVIVTGLPTLSYLDDSYIFVYLLTTCHSWAWSPTGLALPWKRVAYCTQQDSSYVGLRGRGIWPAWISSAGGNRRGRLGMEDRAHQSLFSTRTPEKPEKELLRITVGLVRTGEQHTSVKYDANTSKSVINKKCQAKQISKKLHLRTLLPGFTLLDFCILKLSLSMYSK